MQVGPEGALKKITWLFQLKINNINQKKCRFMKLMNNIVVFYE